MEFAVNEVVLVLPLGIPHRGTVHSFSPLECEIPMVHVAVETSRGTQIKPFQLGIGRVRRMPYFVIFDDHDVMSVGEHASIEIAWDHVKETIAHQRNVALLTDYIDFAALRKRMTPYTLEALKS